MYTCYIRPKESLNFVYQGMARNFGTLVDNSKQGPVPVNFYSPATATSWIQTQQFSELARETDGEFLLVNAKVEDERELVQ